MTRAPLHRRSTKPALEEAALKLADGRHRTWKALGRGQVLVIFVMALTVMIGMMAIVIDVSWYWTNSLRVQRAADAAALAGVVSLPGNETQARADAIKAAGRNGITGTSGCTGAHTPTAVPGICVWLDDANDRQLNVSISAPVGTFFMRAFGITRITASRVSKAQFELPVPMGSPLAYYGVYQLCTVAGVCTAQPDAISGTLPSQGFFGAIEGEGSNRGTGDAFATYFDGKADGAATGPKNAQFDSEGYDYTVVVPGSNATVWVFDPTFCATVSKTTGSGHAGAGDHWLSPNNPIGASTYFQLWNTNNLPLKPQSWTKIADSGTLFEHEYRIDMSATYGNGYNADGVTVKSLANYGDRGTPTGATDCAAGKIASNTVGGYYHNKWWPLATNVGAGTYRVRVLTTQPGDVDFDSNLGESFENMFSLEVTGGAAAGASPQVFGNGRMVTYANIDTGTQTFYLAQISRQIGAGKTLEINLFDPGDVGQRSWLQILTPDGSVANKLATFSFSADANATGNKTGTNVTCLQTFAGTTGATAPTGCTNLTSGGTFYQNSWVRILVPLASTYGSTGLQPAGDPAAGWWKIKYTVGSANDTTTWMVSVRGNPVHLIVP
jgi:hypothetical protein